MRPFGSHALPDLQAAEEMADWDATVEIVIRQIAGLDTAHVETLWADRQGWAALRHLSRPARAELAADPRRLAGAASRGIGAPCIQQSVSRLLTPLRSVRSLGPRIPW
ncbi:hypothetical protein [Streptomyces griseocarneus]|uniref:hypothetical protein n=1 Tax=Streptomyces griseocarneus TaxID=51201 RepID=UPI00167E0886|nr:hypothetical protein [Streptomyces griseocarneus]MBZ6476406.1 hypothetical protein [Streptomyces griseocarneus]